MLWDHSIIGHLKRFVAELHGDNREFNPNEELRLLKILSSVSVKVGHLSYQVVVDLANQLLGNVDNTFEKVNFFRILLDKGVSVDVDDLKNIRGWNNEVLTSAVEALTVLKKSGLSQAINIHACIQHRYPLGVAQAFVYLNKLGMLDINRNKASRYPRPAKLAKALLYFKRTTNDIDRESNKQQFFDDIIQNREPELVAKILFVLVSEPNLNTSANRQSASQSRNPRNTLDILEFLKNRHPGLTQDVFDEIQSRDNLSNLTPVLSHLRNASILNKNNLMNVFRFPSIFNAENVREAFDGLPRHILQRNNVFDRMIEFCNVEPRDDSRAAAEIAAYIGGLEGFHAVAQNRNHSHEINPSESIYRTQSIYESAHFNVDVLFGRYSNCIRDKNALSTVLSEIMNWSNGLGDSDDSKIIKNSVRRMTQLDQKVSNAKIPINKLLALIWIASHDKKYINNLKDAEMACKLGLLQCQRSHNLDANGDDSGKGRDGPACGKGTYNALALMLAGGVYDGLKFVYITKEIAAVKLPCVVREEVVKYLSQLEPSIRGAIVGKVSSDGVESIWPTIRSSVSKRMFDEFYSLYESKTDPNFISLIDNYKWVQLTKSDLNKIRTEDGQAGSSTSVRSEEIFDADTATDEGSLSSSLSRSLPC